MSKDERGRASRRGQPYLEEPEAKPFWANLREHKLTAQRCSSCNKIFGFPPQSHCPHCLSSEYQWVPLSGKGTVYSHIAYHRAWHPAYQDKIPYNVSLVDLDEGGRLVTNVVGCAAGRSQDRHERRSDLRGPAGLYAAEVSAGEIKLGERRGEELP